MTGSDTQTRGGKKSCEAGGRDRSDVSRSQGTPSIAGNKKQLREKH